MEGYIVFIEVITIVKMSILSKAIYRLSANPYANTSGNLLETRLNNPQIYRKITDNHE